MAFEKVTETQSYYDNLQDMSETELLVGINNEDKKVAYAVEKAIPQIARLVEHIVPNMKRGGRIFYLGAGTSGRLGVLDASEIPPTYGMPATSVVGLIAGGDEALRRSLEGAEDDTEKGWEELQRYRVSPLDTVVGVAAVSDIAIEAVTGPEFVTGSTRMKAGTAQKMILNMITTAVMIKIGRVKGNRMINMQLTSEKLIERGTRMIIDETGMEYDTARRLLLTYGSVGVALDSLA